MRDAAGLERQYKEVVRLRGRRMATSYLWLTYFSHLWFLGALADAIRISAETRVQGRRDSRDRNRRKYA